MNYNKSYLSDLEYINHAELEWNNLNGKTILITGATGLIGSVIVDSLMYRNNYCDANIKVVVLSRNKEKIAERFARYIKDSLFVAISQDVMDEFAKDFKADYIIHAASKGNPKSFVDNPIGVMNSNYLGSYRMLELARMSHCNKILFISSGEIYGIVEKENNDDISEQDYGYLDILNSRNCYASSKRAAETLFASYGRLHNVNYNIARLCHTYGASYLPDEDRVIFQFLRNGLKHEPIILKSNGLQKRSYCYVADAVKAIFYILIKGESGEAYNVSTKKSIVSIKDLAEIISKIMNVSVITETQADEEKEGDSGIKHAVLNSNKMEALGWYAKFDIHDGIKKTIEIICDK